MRYGQNPLKADGKTIEPPAEITIGVLNYIPDRVGYFRDQLDSLKLCLASIRQHADQPFDLLVVDNGSCDEVRSFLQDELSSGQIDYLVLNGRNIGKRNGLLQVLQSAPGNLVFYTDGDIYFKPGWMGAHLDILRAFPRAGLIGGVPLRSLAEFCTAGTLRWVEENRDWLSVEKGDLIPEEWTRKFLKSIGLVRQIEKFVSEWQCLEDCRITCNGVICYVGASHMQFLTTREAIGKLPQPHFEEAMGKIDEILGQIIDREGLLRLSTDRPYVYHIGNRIAGDWLMEEFERLLQESSANLTKPSLNRRMHWIWGRWSVRRILRWVYEWAFDIYHQNA